MNPAQKQIAKKASELAEKTSMNLKDKEHTDMMLMFDRLYHGRRLDKEDKSLWAKGRIYQNGEVNELFLAFRQGCAYGHAVSL